MAKRLMIFIPAYQSERTICSVIERIPKEIMKKASEIVVSDNHSSDNTYGIVLNYKKKKKLPKLKVFRQSRNLFYGGNVKSGCNYAIKRNMDIIAVLHSDGQYPPEKINELIRPIEDGNANTVFGSRFLKDPLGGGMPLWRYLGNIFLTKIENMLVGQKFSEWHSGFTAYDCNVLKKLPFSLCDDGYEFTTDILLVFIANKLKIAEIDIPTYYGKESTSPSIKRTFLYFVKSFKLAFYYYLHKKNIRRIKKYVPSIRRSQ